MALPYVSDSDFNLKTRRMWQDRFNYSESVIRNRERAAALNLPGAESEVSNAKGAINALVNEFQHDAYKLANTLTRMMDNNASSAEAIQDKKETIDVLKKDVEEARTLNMIRKEQTDALKLKNIGNYHTSYVGLWVPLHENTRVALAVVSIFFILIGIVAIILIRWTRIFPDKSLNPVAEGFAHHIRRK